jgi:hypothetical protein
VNALPSVGVDGAAVFWGGGGSQPAGVTTTYYSSTPQVFGTSYGFTGFATGPDATATALQVRLDGTPIATPAVNTVSRADGCSFFGGPSWPGCPTIGFTYSFPASSYSQGAHTLSFRVTDGNGLVGTVSFPITIISALSITTTTAPNGLVGAAYNQSLAASGGTPGYTWSVTAGSLPPGLTLSGNTISGTLTTGGTFNFTVQARDSSSPSAQVASQALSVYINNPVSITTASLPGGLATTAYSQTLAATGGTPGYAWSIASGSLPAGLTLNSSGNISGVPTTAGTANFTVRVTDSTTPSAQSATKALSITIGPAVSITTTTLPTGLATTGYNHSLAATGGTPGYSWSLASGSLPAGVTLNAAGLLSGAPTTGGASPFTVRVTDSTSPTAQTATQAFLLTVTPAFYVVTTTLPNAVATTSYSQTLVGNGGTPPYTWTLNSGTLPPGLMLSASTISGTPSTAGAYNFTVRGSDSTNPATQSATQALSIVVGAALSVNTSSLPNALATGAYSQPLSATGGTSPYSWTLTTGSLPPGLSLATAGSIYGTPTTAGTYNFTVQVADTSTPTRTATGSLSITVGAALTIPTAALPSGMLTASYSEALAATGGTSPYTWSIASGALPAGLSLSTAGVITGTPTASGLFSFVVQATDSTAPSAQTATRALTLNVLATLSITTPALPSGLETTPYSQTLAATGGTPAYSWSVLSGALPAGLSLSAVGVFSGTPTAAGDFHFTVQAADSTTPTQLTATQAFSLTIGPRLAISTTSLPDGIAGSSYAQLLVAMGGGPPYTWSISSGALPAGLTLSPGGGLSGTPTTSGAFNITVKATDSTSPTQQTATQALTLNIAAGLSITTTTLPPGLAKTAYTQTLAATGGTSPYTWSIASGSLPPGVTLNTDGAVTGTPTSAGIFAFVVKATDTSSPAAQSATQALSINVSAALSITTPSLAGGMVGQSYSQAVTAAGGTPGYDWSVSAGSLPAGLTLSGNTISGTPTSAGTVSFTLMATDSTSPTAQTATAALSIAVSAAFQITTSSPLPPGLGGNPYFKKVEAAGGTPPYTFTLASGAPPAGLTLQSDGTLSGTPTMPGSFLFSVLASDSTGPTAQTQIKPLAIAITPPLAISTTTLPRTLVAASYAQSLVASGGTPPYAWSISSGALPPGLSLSPDGSLLGIATEAGAFMFVAQVTDTSPVPQTAVQALSITVGDQLAITTSSLPPAVFGATYNRPLTASGGTTPYKWTVVSGSLPPGLTLSLAGYIVGTCTGSGVFTVTVQAVDTTTPTPQSATRTLTLDSNTSLSITSGPLPPAQLSQAYVTSLAAAGGVPPYTWTLAGSPLPTGLSLASDGTISGSPSTAGTSTISFRVTDSAGNNTSRSFSLTVSSPLTITTVTLPPATSGSNYGNSLSASGGTNPYTWTLIGGNLPSGLTLSTSGLISGMPTSAATASITVQVSDNTQPSPQVASKTLSLTVTSPLTIPSASLPGGIIGTPYSHVMAASGGTGPYTWSLSSGALPPGITLAADGTLSGTPSANGSSLFTLQVADSTVPTQTAVRSFTIVVAGALVITDSSLPQGVVGAAYSSALAATGGVPPYTWSVTTGTLPAGLQLSAAGVLSGTPTGAGSSTFSVQAADSRTQIATKEFAISVVSDFLITPPTIPLLYIGQPLTLMLNATGGTAPYTWSAVSGQLPAGVTLGSDGHLSGTPTAPGSFTFTVQAADSTPQTATHAITITVLTPLFITTPSLMSATVGAQYSQQLAASGGAAAYAWSLASGVLPPGLTLGADGEISGTPTAAGAFTFVVAVADVGIPVQNTTREYTLSVVAPLSISTAALSTGLVGTPYTQTLIAAGGVTPHIWSILTGSLPDGLTLDASGVIGGTPTASGSRVVTLQVIDSAAQGQQTATRAFTIAIGNELLIATETLAAGLQSVPYAQTLAAAGGSSTYQWAISSGELPPGLTLSSAGALTGTPTAAGSFTFTARVTDNSEPQQTATKALTLVIHPPLTIVTTSLPNPADGVAYSQTLAAAGGAVPYTWSVSNGSLPPGLLLNPDGTLTGTPSGTGTFTFTVQVADTTQPTPQTASAIFGLQTTVTFRITTTTIPPGIVGAPYSQTFAAVDGTTPYAWNLSAGTLPPGLNLSPDGILDGTPTEAGTFSFTIQATDSAAPNRTSTATFTVQVRPPLTITSTSLPDTIVGETYSSQLTATGGNTPYIWSISSGTLPSGLTLAPNGTLSGIALAPTNTTVTIQVADSSHPTQTVSRSFMINVTLGVSIATSALPDGYIDVPYAFQLDAIGGLAPYTWSATGLPEGLTLTTGGYLSGIPTLTGAFTVNVTARDTYTPAHTGSKTFALTVREGLVITTSTLPDGQVGAPYSQTFGALYGIEPYLWTIPSGSLPPGLTLETDGALHGTPTVAGGYSFTVQLADSSLPSLTTTQTFSLTIQSGLAITTTSLPAGAPNAAYSAMLQASGGAVPYAWTLATGTLPPGLILGADGTITGIPTAVGTFSFTVQVADSNAPRLKATRRFSIAIGASLVISTASLAEARLGAFYRQALTALNGAQPYFWTLEADALPPGLVLLASGDIVGQPSAVGPFTFTVTVQDSTQPPATASQTFTITVAPGFGITTRSLPAGTPGSPYHATLSAQDGVTPYTWSIVLGDLPPGVALNPTTGTIAGTPTRPGIYNLLIHATDSSSPTQTATAQFTLTVDSTLQITTDTLPDATTGTPYYEALSATNGIAPFTWALASALPPGLSLLPSGELYGVPTTQGHFKITVTVTDSSQPMAHASRELTLLVTQSLSIVTDTVPAGTTSKPYAAVISATGGTPPYRFTAGALLPPGLALSSIGVITGTPTSAGATKVTIQVADATGATQAREFVFAIGTALTITTASLPSSPTRAPYLALVKATGGAGAYTWTASANPMPPGLTFLPSIGAFVGTPTASGVYTVQLSVADAERTATTTLTITITDPLTIPPDALPTAQQSVAYSTTLAAVGGLPPYAWTFGTGSTLPAGLTLSTRGVLAGKPTASPGVFSLSLCVTDSAKPQASRACATRSFVVGAAFHINPTAIQSTVPGRPLSHQFTASGGQGSVTWTSAFALPTGLSLSSDGVLSGAATTAGKYRLTLIASDTESRFAVGDFTLIVAAPLSVATLILPAATLGTSYAAGVLAHNGTPPYRWTADPVTVPPGFVLDGSGILYGSPSSVRSDSIMVTVTDASMPPQSATGTIVLSTDAPMTLAGGDLPPATAGSAYSTSLSASGMAPLQWKIVAGQLPSGLVLAAAGSIAGLPIAAGSSTFVASVIDAHGQTAAAAFSLAVHPGLTLGPDTPLPDGTVGKDYTYTFSTAFRGEIAWVVVLGVLPPGLTLSPTGLLTGTPTQPATTSFMLQASAVDQTARQVYTLTIKAAEMPSIPGPTIPSASTLLSPADVGQPYGAALVATDGAQPYAWAITQGLLPAGLTLSPVGTIGGTPTESGSFAFALTVTDANNQSASALYSLSVRAPLSIVTREAVTAHLNSPVNVQLAATGGTPPYAWTATTQLPPGLALSASGLLSGKPTAAGSTTSTITVRDASSATQPAVATLELQITISAGLAITTAALPPAKRDVPYSATITAAGGTGSYTWSVGDGDLPPGLTLNSTGVLSGLPAGIGSYRFALVVRDSAAQSATASFALTVTEPLAITTAATINITLGQQVSLPLSATGGTQPYSWSVTSGTLPSGLSLSPLGVISGYLNTAVAASVTITVRDASSPAATAAQQFAVIATGALVIVTTALPAGRLATPYNANLQASGGSAPYSWSVSSGALPPGINLSADGLIAGAPTTAGPYSFAVTVADSSGRHATTTLACTVASLMVTTTSLSAGVIGTPYTTLLDARGGLPPYQWSTATALPSGLVFTSDGVITGTPSVAFAGSVTLNVTDQANTTATATLSLSIASRPPGRLQITGLNPQLSPTTQTFLSVGLDQPAPVDLSGQLTISFTPDTSGRDDSSLVFVPANSRLLPFTIAKGSTTARFESTPLLQAGTSAGLVTLTASIADSSQSTATTTSRIAATAPVITEGHITSRDAHSLTLELTGYSTTAELSKAVFTFQGIEAPPFTVDVTALFTAWYNSSAAAGAGGLFKYTQAFNFTGDITKLSTVVVTLSNSTGSNSPYAVTVRR